MPDLTNAALVAEKRSDLRHIWRGMISRCHDPISTGYKRYGARGIKVCDRWLTFENFAGDMGERPKGLTIDRRDNDKGYEPGNCRWATPTEQQRNRSNNHVITIDSVAKTLAEWSVESGLSIGTIQKRRKLGWDESLLLSAPTKGPHTFCKAGHALTPENAYVKAKTGARACRACRHTASIRRHRASLPTDGGQPKETKG